MRRSTFPVIFLALFVIATLGGCRKAAVLENAMVPRLLIETRGVNYGALGGDVVTLPVSGTSIAVQAQPLVS